MIKDKVFFKNNYTFAGENVLLCGDNTVLLDASADLVNTIIKKITESQPSLEKNKIFLLAALQIAEEYLKIYENNEQYCLENKNSLKKIEELIEGIILLIH